MILPMLGISRYIFRQLMTGLALVSVALLCVMWLTQSLRFIELIVNKGLSIGRFLQLTSLLMPSFLVVIIPISLFAVTLFTYNKLNTDRELVVMRAAGMSHWSLSSAALTLAAGATLFSIFLSVWFIPWTVRSFHDLQWSIRNDITNVLLQEGAFNKFGEGVTIYVGSRSPAGELVGLLVHDRRKPDHPVTLMAERGALVQTDTGPRVLMVNGNRQQVSVEDGTLSVLYFDQYTLDFTSASNEEGGRRRDAREMTVAELYNVRKSEASPSEFRKARVELHQRFSSPLYNLSLPLIALACLLPSGFNRRGHLRDLGIATALMVICEAASLAASNLATANLFFVPLMYLASLFPILAGVFVLREYGAAWRRPPSVRTSS
jgi:lipopolysaccharide export system permease protein